MKYILFFIPLFILTSCKGQNEIPEELEISFDFIESNWNKEQIETFRNTPERDAVIDQHFGMGMFLRNNLLRHHDDSEQIQKFFSELGISHFDDMSGIILTSFHRSLNKKDIQLQSQVDQVHEYWKPIMDCDLKMDTLARETFNKFEIDDTIVIEMPVGESNSAYDYQCNLDWEFNDSTDLLITGIVTEKYDSDLPVQLRFTVLVLTKNHEDTEVFMKKVYPGNLLSVKLKTCWKIR